MTKTKIFELKENKITRYENTIIESKYAKGQDNYNQTAWDNISKEIIHNTKEIIRK